MLGYILDDDGIIYGGEQSSDAVQIVLRTLQAIGSEIAGLGAVASLLVIRTCVPVPSSAQHKCPSPAIRANHSGNPLAAKHLRHGKPPGISP